MANLLGKRLSRQMYNLGYLIGKHPSHFLIVPFFICFLFATGLQNIKFIKDYDQLYLPSKSRFIDAKKSLDELYPMNYSTIFSRERLIDKSKFGSIILTAKDNQTLFREQVFWEMYVNGSRF